MSRLGPERARAAAGWRFAYLVAQGGLSLTLLVGLAKVLPPEGFGPAAVAVGALVAAQAIGDFGLSQAAVTVLPARLAADPEKRDELVSGAARASLVAAVGAVALTILLALAAGDSAQLPTALVAPAAAAAVVLAGIDGLLRAEGEFRRPVVLVVSSRFGSLAGIPAAAAADTAVAASLGISVGTLVGSLSAFLDIKRRSRLSQSPATMPFVQSAIPLGLSQVLVVASGRLNTVLLSTLTTISSAAAFEAGWRIYQLGQYVAGGLATALAPLIGHAVGAEQYSIVRRQLRRGTALAIGLGTICMMVILLVRDPLSRMLFGGEYGPEVAEAIVPLALVTPLAFVAFLATMTIAVERTGRRWILVANGLGAAGNLSLLLAGVPGDGAPGATAAAAVGVAITSLLLIGGLVQQAGRWDRPTDRIGADDARAMR